MLFTFIRRLYKCSYWVFYLFFMAATAQASALLVDTIDQPLSIAGQWKFHTGDDPAWAQPHFDDTTWGQIKVPLSWVDQGYPEHVGIGWYRLHLRFDIDNDQWSKMGISLGEIHSAYEVYAGGSLLGGVGALPPNPAPNYDKRMTYPIPHTAFSADGTLVVALRVWGGGNENRTWEGGTYDGPFLIGSYSELSIEALETQIPSLLLAVIFLVFGIQHLYLYRNNRQLPEYLWYGLLAITIGVYAFFISQWDHKSGMSFLLQKKIEYLVLFLIPPLTIQMIMTLLDINIARWLRAYQYSFVVLALIVVAVPTLHIHFVMLPLWQAWALPLIIFMPLFVPYKAIKGNIEARVLWIGLAVFGVTALNDLFIDMYHLSTIRILPIGFAAITVSMMISVANKFTASFNHLETEVATRTSELQEANERLSTAALTDALTGILNRRGFSELAEKELQRFVRSQRTFSLIIADIDHFKEINDRYGHACGDYVLQNLVTLITRQLRDVDVFARWGGEEFILLLPETELAGGRTLAEKLRYMLAAATFEYEDHRFQTTMTFGVAEYQQDQNLDACLQLADRALYRGKESGRNKVEVESQPVSV